MASVLQNPGAIQHAFISVIDVDGAEIGASSLAELQEKLLLLYRRRFPTMIDGPEWPAFVSRLPPPAELEGAAESEPPGYTGKLRELKKLLDEGMITEEELDAKKRQLLGID